MVISGSGSSSAMVPVAVPSAMVAPTGLVEAQPERLGVLVESVAQQRHCDRGLGGARREGHRARRGGVVLARHRGGLRGGGGVGAGGVVDGHLLGDGPAQGDGERRGRALGSGCGVGDRHRRQAVVVADQHRRLAVAELGVAARRREHQPERLRRLGDVVVDQRHRHRLDGLGRRERERVGGVGVVGSGDGGAVRGRKVDVHRFGGVGAAEAHREHRGGAVALIDRGGVVHQDLHQPVVVGDGGHPHRVAAAGVDRARHHQPERLDILGDVVVDQRHRHRGGGGAGSDGLHRAGSGRGVVRSRGRGDVRQCCRPPSRRGRSPRPNSA